MSNERIEKAKARLRPDRVPVEVVEAPRAPESEQRHARYKVEIRGLSFVTMSEYSWGKDIPLEYGPAGSSEPIEVIVSASNPKDARARVRDAIEKLLVDDLDGAIPRDRGPGSY